MSTQLVIDIRPIEIDGKHYISMNMNGRELEQRGPYPTAAAAEAMARELITAAQEAATKVPPRAEIADLKDNHEFISDCCRYNEGVLSEAAVRKNGTLTLRPGSYSAAMTRWSGRSRKPRSIEFDRGQQNASAPNSTSSAASTSCPR